MRINIPLPARTDDLEIPRRRAGPVLPVHRDYSDQPYETIKLINKECLMGLSVTLYYRTLQTFKSFAMNGPNWPI